MRKCWTTSSLRPRTKLSSPPRRAFAPLCRKSGRVPHGRLATAPGARQRPGHRDQTACFQCREPVPASAVTTARPQEEQPSPPPRAARPPRNDLSSLTGPARRFRNVAILALLIRLPSRPNPEAAPRRPTLASWGTQDRSGTTTTPLLLAGAGARIRLPKLRTSGTLGRRSRRRRVSRSQGSLPAGTVAAELAEIDRRSRRRHLMFPWRSREPPELSDDPVTRPNEATIEVGPPSGRQHGT